jgi:hypothetical protein
MAWGVPEISAVLYAAGLALVGWYGIWLSKVVKQKEELLNGQVKAKDATIETLKAQIDKLSKETAPAMAAQVKQLSEYAESMAKTLLDEKKKYDDLVTSTGRVVTGETDALEFERMKIINAVLTDRVTEMRASIRVLRHETNSLLRGYNSDDPVGEDVLSPESATRIRPGSIDTSEPSPMDEESKTNKKKFKI